MCVIDPGCFYWNNGDRIVQLLLDVELLLVAVKDKGPLIWLMVGAKDAQNFVDRWDAVTKGGQRIVYKEVRHELPYTANAAIYDKFLEDLKTLA
jgi:hypothetical protein